MPSRTVIAVPRNGRLELLERIELPEGQPIQVTLEFPVASNDQEQKPALAIWDLGIKGPLTREQIYDDLI